MHEEPTSRETRERQRLEFREAHPLRVVDVAGVDWSYIDVGSGDRAVLWFHGAASDAYQAQRFTLPLAEDARFLCPTVPAVSTLDDLVRGVDAILAAEGVASFVVAGGSFGGLLAQAVAHRRAEAVEGLMVFDTSGPNVERARKNRRSMAILRFLPWPLLRWIFEKSLGRLLRIPGEPTAEQQRELEHATDQFRDSLRRLTRERLLAHSELASEFLASEPRAARWSGPTLVIRSADDPSGKDMVAPETLYPDARLVEVDGVGHLGSLLRLEDYLGAFRGFLHSLPATRG